MPIKIDVFIWQSTEHRRLVAASALAVLSVCRWIGVIFAGWIAYTITESD